MDDGLLDLVLVERSGGLDILHANARARGATHVDALPYVEQIRCRGYALTPRRTPEGLAPELNLDGALPLRALPAPLLPRCAHMHVCLPPTPCGHLRRAERRRTLPRALRARRAGGLRRDAQLRAAGHLGRARAAARDGTSRAARAVETRVEVWRCSYLSLHG